jgi:hypothetical protein
MAYQMTKKQISSGSTEARMDIKEAGNVYREEYQSLGVKRQDIKAYLKQRGQHLRDWLKLLKEVQGE